MLGKFQRFASLSVLQLCLASFLPLAGSAQESDAIVPDPNSRMDLPQISVSDKLAIQENAEKVADEAIAYVRRNKKSDAACLIRYAVRNAMRYSRDKYAWYILTLNEKLESNNVLQALGLKQRPHAALTSAQYSAELGLYGQRTLPAAVLSMVGSEAVQQGQLGDCWFLSTLAVVADEHPQLIASMIQVNQDASYTVKFPGYSNW